MDQRDKVVGGEGKLESAHLVQDAAEAPHVRLVVVRLPPADLGREVVRGPDGRSGQVQRVAQRFGNPEISDFDEVLRRYKYVLRLQVSVQNILLVNVLKPEHHLNEPT